MGEDRREREEQQGAVGVAAIVGRPNVGKSTLLNALLGQKIAIVSPRPQTTRNRILGVRTWDGNQLVLVDTPGIHRRRANLNRFMVREAIESLHGVDCVLLLTEIAPPRGEGGPEALDPEDAYVLEQVQEQLARPDAGAARELAGRVIVVLNKLDRLRDRRPLLPLMAGWRDRGFEALVPISALTGEGIPALLEEIVLRLPRGPQLYPDDMLTDRSERFLCGELIREQVFQRAGQEVPYSVAVEIERFEERPERGDVMIEAIIHAERESQKAILVGKGGQQIKAIGTAARNEISRLLACKVHLRLTVHVERNWTHSPGARRKLGYDA
jgi:GTP-binding protein Era